MGRICRIARWHPDLRTAPVRCDRPGQAGQAHQALYALSADPLGPDRAEPRRKADRREESRAHNSARSFAAEFQPPHRLFVDPRGEFSHAGSVLVPVRASTPDREMSDSGASGGGFSRCGRCAPCRLFRQNAIALSRGPTASGNCASYEWGKSGPRCEREGGAMRRWHLPSLAGSSDKRTEREAGTDAPRVPSLGRQKPRVFVLVARVPRRGVRPS
jgi:hypothetical protein